MDSGFGIIRLSPSSSTAVLAAGATLVALCVAIWKQRKSSQEQNSEELSKETVAKNESRNDETLVISLPNSDVTDLKTLSFRHNILDVNGKFAKLYCERVFRKRRDIFEYEYEVVFSDAFQFERFLKPTISRAENKLSKIIFDSTNIRINPLAITKGKRPIVKISRDILERGLSILLKLNHLENVVQVYSDNNASQVLPDVIPFYSRFTEHSITDVKINHLENKKEINNLSENNVNMSIHNINGTVTEIIDSNLNIPATENSILGEEIVVTNAVQQTENNNNEIDKNANSVEVTFSTTETFLSGSDNNLFLNDIEDKYIGTSNDCLDVDPNFNNCKENAESRTEKMKKENAMFGDNELNCESISILTNCDSQSNLSDVNRNSKKFEEVIFVGNKNGSKGISELSNVLSFEAEMRGIFSGPNFELSSAFLNGNSKISNEIGVNDAKTPGLNNCQKHERSHRGEGDDTFVAVGLQKMINIPSSGSKESSAAETERSAASSIAPAARNCDVTERSRGSREAPHRESSGATRQMDRRTSKRAVAGDSCIFESSVTSETRFVDDTVVNSVVSCLTLDDSGVWSSEVDTSVDEGSESMSVTTTVVSGGDYRPRTIDGTAPKSPQPTKRLLGLLSRDEQRRSKSGELLKDRSPEEPKTSSIDFEWDRILSDVLASVSELERYGEERRRRDVTEDAEERIPIPHPDQSSTPAMEEDALSPGKGETPTKVKSLRFKLDPDIFDVPSDDSFYDDEDDHRPSWRRQQKYRAFSTLQVGDEPVQLVSVHASVVPAGQKMVARPVGIDLHVRLTEEKQSKRTHIGTSPSQVKRRSPVSESRVGWCHELSPVTENVDWRDTFTPVTRAPQDPELKPVLNGILKSPSPKIEIPVESANPFKEELTNGNHNPKPPPLTNGVPKRPERKLFSLPKKKFVPDPEAVDRITGYKIALSKPPLPPPLAPKLSLQTKITRAELARKQYLDTKASLAGPKTDGSRMFQQFVTQAQTDRARINISVPDFSAIEKAVREKWEKERSSVSPRVTPTRDDVPKSGDSVSSRGSTPDDAWTSYVQTCRKYLGRRSQSMSYLETDVDLPVGDDKWCSTSALNNSEIEITPVPLGESEIDESQEDLDENGRARSEHELRIQRSLQNLPLPDWYKRNDKPKSGFLLGSGPKEKRGWAAVKSLASSTSSLSSVGLKKPICSLRSSRENIPWSRGSASPDGPALSLALAKAFREPYLGWRSRTYTTSSGVSSSPRTSPPSWCAATTDEETNEVSFDGEDAFGPTSSGDGCQPNQPPSPDDTAADATTVSMDTGELIKLPCGEDTCEDINNMSMETCELIDSNVIPEVPSPHADNTGDDIDNLSTDTTEDKRKESKSKRYSYSQSIYHSEWDLEEESRGDRKIRKNDEDREQSPSSDHKVIWIESSFVGSRTTTSIMVLPDDRPRSQESNLERPASR